MSDTFSSLTRRLDKVEEQIGARKRREELVNCDCQETRIVVHDVDSPVNEEAAGVLPCSVHGFDRSEHVIHVRFLAPGGPSDGKRLSE